MSSHNGDLHEPSFATPLTPYLKSRQETLRIRQALTLYLQSFFVYSDAGDVASGGSGRQCSHLELCLPSDHIIGVKRVPSEIKGLRRDYLETLRRNLAAKQEYSELVTASSSGRSEKNTSPPATRSSSSTSNVVLDDYLALLRAKQQYEKLQVYSHYLDQITEASELSTDPDHPSLNDANSRWQNRVDDLRRQAYSQASETSSQAENLIFKLEQAVIRAQKNLDREKRLLQELKSTPESSAPPQVRNIPQAVRLTALRKVRDELVQWVEEKLALSNDDNAESVPCDRDATGQSLLQAEELKRQIMDEYAGYVQARAALLGAISVVTATNANQPLDAVPTSTVASQKSGNPTPTLNSHPMASLAYVEGILLPLSRSRRSLALQKTHLSNLLNKERQSTQQMLGRLHDESHLLPEYPILSHHERFKHVTRKSVSRALPSDENNNDPVMKHAQAWAFASTAAQSQELEHVERKITTGKEFAHDAHETLKYLYDTLNKDIDQSNEAEALEEDEGTGESDIWTAESKSTGRRRAAKRKESTTGPWAKVNGKIGLIGDK